MTKEIHSRQFSSFAHYHVTFNHQLKIITNIIIKSTHPRFATWHTLHRLTSEESVILDTLFPKVFALISPFKKELDYVFIVTL